METVGADAVGAVADYLDVGLGEDVDTVDVDAVDVGVDTFDVRRPPTLFSY